MAVPWRSLYVVSHETEVTIEPDRCPSAIRCILVRISLKIVPIPSVAQQRRRRSVPLALFDAREAIPDHLSGKPRQR